MVTHIDDAALLLGWALVSAGVWLVAGAGWALVAAGALLLAFGAAAALRS